MSVDAYLLLQLKGLFDSLCPPLQLVLSQVYVAVGSGASFELPEHAEWLQLIVRLLELVQADPAEQQKGLCLLSAQHVHLNHQRLFSLPQTVDGCP